MAHLCDIRKFYRLHILARAVVVHNYITLINMCRGDKSDYIGYGLKHAPLYDEYGRVYAQYTPTESGIYYLRIHNYSQLPYEYSFGLFEIDKMPGAADVTYNIRFDANGATSGKMSTLRKVPYNKKVKLTANKYSRKGYKFLGWNTKKNGKGKMYKNKASVKNLTKTNRKTVTLYAIWKKK